MAENQRRASHVVTNQTGKSVQPVPPTHVVIDPPLPANGSPLDPGKDKGNPPEKPLPRFARPEWVIVYVTVVYAIVAWLTLGAIKQQAIDARKFSDDAALVAQGTLDAMQKQAAVMEFQAVQMVNQTGSLQSSVIAAQDTANAAQKSADALVSAERAWTLAGIRKTVSPFPYTTMISMPDTVKCELTFKNYGSTPAVVESYSCQTRWTIPPIPFPPIPEYGETRNTRIILAPGEERAMGIVFPVEEFPNFRLECAIFVGFVTYGGIFEGQRTTKFCFGFDEGEGSFIPIGPPAYNDAS